MPAVVRHHGFINRVEAVTEGEEPLSRLVQVLKDGADLVKLVNVSLGVVPEVDVSHDSLQYIPPNTVCNEVIAAVTHQLLDHFSTGYLVVSSVQHTSLHAPNKILFL